MMARLFSPAVLGAVAGAAMLIFGSAASASPVGAGPVGSDQPQATTVAACRAQAGLTLRVGPGTAFPAVGSLLQGTTFRGVSFVRTGVPNGSWVEIELVEGTSSGFVPADTQSVRCTPLVTSLPAGQIPPVPSQTQSSRERISRVPVDGGDLSSDPVVRGPVLTVNNGQYVIVPGVDQNQIKAVLQADSGVLRFGDAVGFGVEPLDRRTGRAVGSGIQEVRFEITYVDDESGDELTAYRTVERNAPYCLFSDENGVCNVFRFSKMGYKWPDTQFGKGLPRPVNQTDYTALITIVPKSGPAILWRWNFRLNGLAVEFP